MFNARSVRNKTDFLRDFIIEQKLYVFGIVESWLKSDEKHIIREILPEGYSFKSDQTEVLKSNLKIKFHERQNILFEQIFSKIQLANRTLKLLLV